MPSIAIGDALFTKTQQRVPGLLYGKPDKSFYANEIVRRAAMGRGTIHRALERLVSADLVLVSRSGNQLHYQANPENPVYTELLGMVRKTFGVADVLRGPWRLSMIRSNWPWSMDRWQKGVMYNPVILISCWWVKGWSMAM